MGHKKMSKSLGNVVDPQQLSDVMNVDTVRYFLLRESTLQNDSGACAFYFISALTLFRFLARCVQGTREWRAC